MKKTQEEMKKEPTCKISNTYTHHVWARGHSTKQNKGLQLHTAKDINNNHDPSDACACYVKSAKPPPPSVTYYSKHVLHRHI